MLFMPPQKHLLKTTQSPLSRIAVWVYKTVTAAQKILRRLEKVEMLHAPSSQ